MKTQTGISHSFISLVEIIASYQEARTKFYTNQKLYQICRSHAKNGGAWPNLTRKHRIKMEQAAKEARQWQQLRDNLERMRAEVAAS